MEREASSKNTKKGASAVASKAYLPRKEKGWGKAKKKKKGGEGRAGGGTDICDGVGRFSERAVRIVLVEDEHQHQRKLFKNEVIGQIYRAVISVRLLFSREQGTAEAKACPALPLPWRP